MSKKSGAIAELIEQFKGRELDAHYLGYFECFNRRLYFEAHDVLEELWLAQRSGPNYSFYKGLIQLAGAFVHLQKEPPPPRRLPVQTRRRQSAKNIRDSYEQLSVDQVRALIHVWLKRLETANFETNPLIPGHEPKLRLESCKTHFGGTQFHRVPDLAICNRQIFLLTNTGYYC